MRRPECCYQENRPDSPSPGVRFIAIEFPIRRKCLSKRSDALQRTLAALVARNVESPFARDVDLNLVAFLQVQGLDNGSRKANRKAVAAPSSSVYRYTSAY